MRLKLVLVFALMVLPLLGWSQVLEVENHHELTKNARKGELYHFSFNEDTQEYLLIYRRDKKKEWVYEIYKFDADFNQIEHETIEGTVETRKKYTSAFPTYVEEEGWNNPQVLRVENNWGGQIVLLKGYLTREWATKEEWKGDYKYTTRYMKYKFHQEDKIKPKFEGLVKVPEDAPGFVKKMAQSQGSKLTLVDYLTDEPAVEITTGTRNFVYPSLWSKSRDYASANGDVVILASNTQMDYKTKNTIVMYVAMKYSAQDLSQIYAESFTFEYPTFPMYKQHLSDGTMAFIFAPSSYTKNDDPNPRNYHFVRISKDAEVIDNINFESVGGPWKIENMFLTKDNEVYIFGQTSLKKKDKEPQKVVPNLKKFDNLQVMKISDHKMDYLTSLTFEEINEKMIIPDNVKKVHKHDAKRFWFAAEPVITSQGQMFLSSNSEDMKAVYYYQFDDKGEFVGLYAIPIDENKNMIEQGLVQLIFENPDKTMTCLLAECDGEKKGRQLRYPKTATLNVTAHTLSDLQTFGYDKDKYYLDDGYPLTFIDNNSKLTFFSRDKKSKNIWFGRIKLGMK